MKNFKYAFILLIALVLVFSGCAYLPKPSTSATDTNETDDTVEVVSFEEGVQTIIATFKDYEIGLNVYLPVEDLAQVEEESLDAVEERLNELKEDVFKTDDLKDLTDVFLSLLADFRAKKELAVQSLTVSAIEELSTFEQCQQLNEFDVLVEKTQNRVNAYTSTNQKLQLFVKNYSSEAESEELELNELLLNRQTDEAMLFEGFSNIEKSVDDLKKICEEGVEPINPEEGASSASTSIE